MKVDKITFTKTFVTVFGLGGFFFLVYCTICVKEVRVNDLESTTKTLDEGEQETDDRPHLYTCMPRRVVLLEIPSRFSMFRVNSD